MIGLDTNVLLRLTLRDDEQQFQRAAAFVQSQLSRESPGYINPIVLVEFAWTLRHTFKTPKDVLVAIISKLSEAENLVTAREEIVALALETCRREGTDFPDALIAAVNLADGCRMTVTFDVAFARSGEAALIP